MHIYNNGNIGRIILVLYGIMLRHSSQQNLEEFLQAYGGILILMAIILRWQVHKTTHDRFDIIGGIVASEMIIIMYWPRN